MHVTARTFASLRELSIDRCDLQLADDATLADAWTALAARYPAVEPHRPYVRAARNGAYAPWTDPVSDGDEIAFLPPVSGGAGHLTNGPIDVDALERAMSDPEHGAVVTFVGRARRRADDGREVVELEYEAFGEMAEAVLDEVEVEATQRWGASVSVVHRTGLVAIGEAAVAIVVAAPHRSEAYEASRFAIEAIKERLPIWKRERFVDGSEWKRPGA
jgi:molybdopterin synthase catalytic subunit